MCGAGRSLASYRCALLIASLALPLGCSSDPSPASEPGIECTTEWRDTPAGRRAGAGPAALSFLVTDTCFGGLDSIEMFYDPWEVLATDMDLDGDQDVLVNWHHLQRLELFENEGGRLELLNPRGDDRSGLYDNRDVPDLFMAPDVAAEAIDPDVPGVYVWAPQWRLDPWRIRIQLDDSGDPFDLVLRGNVDIVAVHDLDQRRYVRLDRQTAVIPADFIESGLEFGFELLIIAHTLEVQTPVADGDVPPTIYAGRSLTPFRDGRAVLTKPDPHGMAWVDAWGSEHPDLFLSRGAVRGRLAPQEPGKIERFFTWLPGPRRYELVDDSVIPRGYGRSRQVAWVDIDGDGQNELFVANTRSANTVLRRDGERFVDVAADLGLDLFNAFLFAFLDLDEDGDEDLILLDSPGRVLVGLNRAGSGFDLQDGADYGLLVPDEAVGDELWSEHIALHTFDYDLDGRLDLWMSGYRAPSAESDMPRRSLLFRNLGQRFEDMTASTGLGDVTGHIRVIPGDFDNDGDVDVMAIGGPLLMLRNEGGARFEAQPIDENVSFDEHTTGTVLDLQGDGWLDALVVFRRRHAIINTSNLPNRFLRVRIQGDEPPIGAVVRAYYDDGTVRAQRYGSADCPRWSQALNPLHFGIAEGRRVEEIGVVWPGDTEEERAALGGSQTEIVLTAD